MSLDFIAALFWQQVVKEIRHSRVNKKIAYNIRMDKVYASSNTTIRFICKAPRFSLAAQLALITQTVIVIKVNQLYSHYFVCRTFILNFNYDLFIKSQFICLHKIHNVDSRNANIYTYLFLLFSPKCVNVTFSLCVFYNLECISSCV